jgi:hypothetical protein
VERVIVVEVCEGGSVYGGGWRGVEAKAGPAVLVSEIVKNFKREGVGRVFCGGRIDEGGEGGGSRQGLHLRSRGRGHFNGILVSHGRVLSLESPGRTSLRPRYLRSHNDEGNLVRVAAEPLQAARQP